MIYWRVKDGIAIECTHSGTKWNLKLHTKRTLLLVVQNSSRIFGSLIILIYNKKFMKTTVKKLLRTHWNKIVELIHWQYHKIRRLRQAIWTDYSNSRACAMILLSLWHYYSRLDKPAFYATQAVCRILRVNPVLHRDSSSCLHFVSWLSIPRHDASYKI